MFPKPDKSTVAYFSLLYLTFDLKKVTFQSRCKMRRQKSQSSISHFIWAQFHQLTYSFYACSSQKRKNSVKLPVSFMLLGSTGAKAARRMLMKLIPAVKRLSNLIISKSKNYLIVQSFQILFLKLFLGVKSSNHNSKGYRFE